MTHAISCSTTKHAYTSATSAAAPRIDILKGETMGMEAASLAEGTGLTLNPWRKDTTMVADTNILHERDLRAANRWDIILGPRKWAAALGLPAAKCLFLGLANDGLSFAAKILSGDTTAITPQEMTGYGQVLTGLTLAAVACGINILLNRRLRAAPVHETLDRAQNPASFLLPQVGRTERMGLEAIGACEKKTDRLARCEEFMSGLSEIEGLDRRIIATKVFIALMSELGLRGTTVYQTSYRYHLVDLFEQALRNESPYKTVNEIHDTFSRKAGRPRFQTEHDYTRWVAKLYENLTELGESHHGYAARSQRIMSQMRARSSADPSDLPLLKDL
jgi:hypothetical protein